MNTITIKKRPQFSKPWTAFIMLLMAAIPLFVSCDQATKPSGPEESKKTKPDSKPVPAPSDDKAALQGVWVAQSAERDGKQAPPDVLKQMQFTFKGDKLFVRGNTDDDDEEECQYKIDPTKSPKYIDIMSPTEHSPVQGIYEINGDELRLCIARSQSRERPTEFSTKEGSRTILTVLKRTPPE